jgi:hypothetical protein
VEQVFAESFSALDDAERQQLLGLLTRLLDA